MLMFSPIQNDLLLYLKVKALASWKEACLKTGFNPRCACASEVYSPCVNGTWPLLYRLSLGVFIPKLSNRLFFLLFSSEFCIVYSQNLLLMLVVGCWSSGFVAYLLWFWWLLVPCMDTLSQLRISSGGFTVK